MCNCATPFCTDQTHSWRQTVLHEQLVRYCENCSACYVVDDEEVSLHEKA